MTLDEEIKHLEEIVEWHEKFKRIKAVTLEECMWVEEDRQLAEWLKELKQLRQKTRWIPVSERLPNLDDFSGSRRWQQEVLITGYLSFDDTKDLFISSAFADDVIYGRVHNTVVVAWMPLPEPYRAESEENNVLQKT